MDGKTLGVDEDPHANQEPKAVIQDIVWRLSQEYSGQNADPADVLVALNAALAEAGIPEQPAPWTEGTAVEIAGGREVVLDVKDQAEPQQVSLGDQTVNILGKHSSHRPGGDGPQPTRRARRRIGRRIAAERHPG